MKLLTASGLLYSAVQSQTVDGHYSAFPEIDWTVAYDEVLASTTTAAGTITIGLNPMVTSVMTGYDGGKYITGNGQYTKTATFGWVLKLFGIGTSTNTCANETTVTEPTGYNLWTLFTGASTTATCATQASWIYTDSKQGVKRGIMFLGAAENWKDGREVVAGTAYGQEPMISIVGGISQQQSYGMGAWNSYIQQITERGVEMTQALYKATGTDFKDQESTTAANEAANVGMLTQFLLTLATPVASGTAEFASHYIAQNACTTAVTPISVGFLVATVTEQPQHAFGGFAGSATSCYDYAIDEMSISGNHWIVQFDADIALTNTLPLTQIKGVTANTTNLKKSTEEQATLPDNVSTLNSALLAAYNFGVIKQIGSRHVAAAQLANLIVLFSAPETYGRSYIHGHYDVGANGIVAIPIAQAVDLAQNTYGQINAMWMFNNNPTVASGTGLWNNIEGFVAFCGMHLGKGMVSAVGLKAVAAIATDSDTEALSGLTLLGATATGVSYVNNSTIREIRSPTGGVMQFKGLTQTTSNDKYVEVNCRHIEGYWTATAWTDIDNTTTGTSGFIVSCMTGISQCTGNNILDVTSATSMYQTTSSQLTLAEHTSCLNDPRYMTWRQMTVQLKYDGTVQWWRTDSMWQRNDTILASAWGPGTTNSAHTTSGNDNSNITAANDGMGYVFALYDGSGISLSHLPGGTAKIVAPTSNTTAGTGANALTTANASFTNSFPDRVNDSQNFCSSTNLLLSGLADTSALASTITAYSDGYLATVTMALDWFQAGAAGGWRGVCMVYYTSQYIQDDTNGAVCMAAVQATTGPNDLSGVFLIHVKASTWQPPAASGSVTPSSLALTDAKYGIVTAPAALRYVYTGGYYASAAWYQPKYASSYADIARFGKDRYTGSYCMQGVTSTSYFTAPAAGIQLASAVKLAAGAIALGSAILAM